MDYYSIIIYNIFHIYIYGIRYITIYCDMGHDHWNKKKTTGQPQAASWYFATPPPVYPQ